MSQIAKNRKQNYCCRIPTFHNVKLSNCKNGTLYKFTDGPGGRPTENLPNSNELAGLHRTVPELRFLVD
jgi:hypothetical protein